MLILDDFGDGGKEGGTSKIALKMRLKFTKRQLLGHYHKRIKYYKLLAITKSMILHLNGCCDEGIFFQFSLYRQSRNCARMRKYLQL